MAHSKGLSEEEITVALKVGVLDHDQGPVHLVFGYEDVLYYFRVVEFLTNVLWPVTSSRTMKVFLSFWKLPNALPVLQSPAGRDEGWMGFALLPVVRGQGPSTFEFSE